MGFLMRKLVEEAQQDNKHYYCPGSMLHGLRKAAYGGPTVKPVTILKAEIGRLDDFLDYLFHQSEHCDHISYSDAYKEFEEWELKQILKSTSDK